MDDNLLWTATSSSNIKRWYVPGRRATRTEQGREYISPLETRGERQSCSPSPSQHASTLCRNSDADAGEGGREGEETWYGIPFESLVKLTSANEGYSGFGISRGRDPDIATLYSAASVMSVPRLIRSPFSSVFHNVHANASTTIPRSMSPAPAPADSMLQRPQGEETIHPYRVARAEFEEREMATDAIPLNSVPDEIIHGEHGLIRCAVLNDRMHALTVNTAGEVAVWDLVRGSCLGKFAPEEVAEASVCGSSRSGGSNGQEMERSPREALETVKERIEGEAVVAPWANVDTKTGLLTVHLHDRCFDAEIYADEAGFGSDRHFSDEARSKCVIWYSVFERSLFRESQYWQVGPAQSVYTLCPRST
jgi:WD repeat-containing protein 48